MNRRLGEVGLHWFGANRQVKISIPADIVPDGTKYVTFGENRSGLVVGFSERHGRTLTVKTPKTYSACLPLNLSRRFLNMKRGLNRFAHHKTRDGYVIYVAMRKKEEEGA